MRKFTSLAARGAVITLLAGTALAATGAANAQPASLGANIATTAKGQIGAGPCGLNNKGSYWGRGTAQTGSCGPDHTEAHPWCADFVGWVWWKNNVGGRMSRLGDLASSFTGYGPMHSTPKVGDAILYNQHTSDVGDDHVAIVVAISGSRITVVGGNQGRPGSVSSHTWTSYKVGTRVNDTQWISGYVTPVAG
ncbi:MULTISPECIES: CHAP domain-containing protein [unclassified Streptomyces]|uniref:CHAP domain-containing protein n=1 Tax=unclassified Streptomyces TaxID=2593676 RepID=UPI00224E56F9|nr:CHAP domain-containing protein [Streptomyces sp. NBC_01443]MCX4625526.1 CHAP domain-containing protein [Streptomyces sp. NBC_01443]WSW49111.1 CHAP domain-containing protein [Streptomyces sp. NBC_01001]